MASWSSWPLIVVASTLPWIGESKKCGDRDVHFFMGITGSCTYFRDISITPQPTAEAECANLNEYPNEWRLPKIDNDQKRKKLSEIVDTKISGRWAQYWRSLIRDNADDPQELQNWANPAKWRWTDDNTTLQQSFPNSTIPWTTGEPNGGNRPVKEGCGFAHQMARSLMTWYDVPCAEASYGILLVCESTDISTTTSTTTTTTTTTTASATTTTESTTKSSAGPSSTTSTTADVTNEHDDAKPDEKDNSKKAIEIVFTVAGLLFRIIVVVVVACVVRRRKREKGMTGRERASTKSMLTADSEQSGPYENMHRLKKGDKKSGVAANK